MTISWDVSLSVFIEYLSKLLSYAKMHGRQFCGFKLSINMFPHDVIEWLHGIHGMNQLFINICTRVIHGMNEMFVNIHPCALHGLDELSVNIIPCDARESGNTMSESGLHGLNGSNGLGTESPLNGMNGLNLLGLESS